MRRLVRAIDLGLRVVGATCLAALTALVLVQVALRYGGGSVPAFTEELARYAMVWMALLVAAVGVHEGSHIRIDVVPLALARLAPRLHRTLEAAVDAVSLTIFLVLVWYGVDMVRFAAAQSSEGLRIPLSYPYAVVPGAFALAALFAAIRLAAPDAQR